MASTQHRIMIGDSRRMSEIADESIHLAVTSPPYWQLKDYGSSGQIGFDDSYERYINNLNLVWKECSRVLHKGCRLCVNIGDQFARSAYYGRYKVIPIRTEIIKFCEAEGLDYMGAVIWQKVTTCNTTGGATVMGSFPYPRSGVLKLDYEFILIFKKLGKAPAVSKPVKEQSKLSTAEWNEYFSGHWNFPGEKQSGHIAMFPEELPRRLVRMFSFVGDTVLDPFLGSGTTTLAAVRLGRNSVGYEINPGFLPVIRERLGILTSDAEGDLGLGSAGDAGGARFKIVRSKTAPADSEADFEKEIAGLLYSFRDPTGLDKKVDPRERRFGSRIDNKHSPREAYHRVKRVISSRALVLDGDLEVRLIGIKAIPGKEKEAVAFLKEKTAKSKVYLRPDPKMSGPDERGAAAGDSTARRWAYVYLSNRTFLNAHLIKQGLADVDTSIDFKHKSRFLK
ncbi:DNA methyltransferase, partial [Candidatus Eisenbacteria bacterium]